MLTGLITLPDELSLGCIAVKARLFQREMEYKRCVFVFVVVLCMSVVGGPSAITLVNYTGRTKSIAYIVLRRVELLGLSIFVGEFCR
ncbi:hypothetical protein C497_01045 [Halalkalicoccus jeotgali B3]|uniref:Uncharacterized protein n=1 Tax=Halalkalicoccus jeotgali (strain DSM 18796 / CECT 7217 / JCM 14584 / KCTC 4019 / B3) TaxID=795797 RepID=D8JBE5_HALJB|nr:hypothetical protein HacjB3_16201 [Halalkalicoccus jeotgali B3]ELY41305.1 hypothetical protein C497_01045 [Halalkalicoccus jeotgali B3]